MSENSDSRVIGIDLGTTYSLVAWVDSAGRPSTVINSEGDLTTPSVVFFDKNGVIVGKEAVKASEFEPERVARFAKRDMGRVAFHKKIRGEPMPPEAIQALVLQKLKNDAALKLGHVGKAVITVPAYFDEPRRKATEDAGRLAGLDVLDILNEPTAAAISYGVQQGFIRLDGQESEREVVLVYDLGGGTFDVTLMEIQGKKFNALATAGDVMLGGVDWTDRIVDLVGEQFMAQHGVDPRADECALQSLMLEAEDAKRALTARDEVNLMFAHDGFRLRTQITRQQFEAMTGDLVDRTVLTVRKVLREAKLQWSDVTRLLLVGGSSRMPAVQEALEKESGKQVDRSLSPDEAVGHGAAVYAALLSGNQTDGVRDIKVKNVNSHDLGVLGKESGTGRDRRRVMIPRNTPLPCTSKSSFKTFRDNQPSVVVKIVEGGDASGNNATPIGKCVVTGLPENLPAQSVVEVTFRYGSNGRISVSAFIPSANKQADLSIERAGGMSDESFAFWKARIDAGLTDEILQTPAPAAVTSPPTAVTSAPAAVTSPPASEASVTPAVRTSVPAGPAGIAQPSPSVTPVASPSVTQTVPPSILQTPQQSQASENLAAVAQPPVIQQTATPESAVPVQKVAALEPVVQQPVDATGTVTPPEVHPAEVSRVAATPDFSDLANPAVAESTGDSPAIPGLPGAEEATSQTAPVIVEAPRNASQSTPRKQQKSKPQSAPPSAPPAMTVTPASTAAPAGETASTTAPTVASRETLAPVITPAVTQVAPEMPAAQQIPDFLPPTPPVASPPKVTVNTAAAGAQGGDAPAISISPAIAPVPAQVETPAPAITTSAVAPASVSPPISAPASVSPPASGPAPAPSPAPASASASASVVGPADSTCDTDEDSSVDEDAEPVTPPDIEVAEDDPEVLAAELKAARIRAAKVLAINTGLHALVLAILAMIVLPAAEKLESFQILSSVTDDELPEEMQQDVTMEQPMEISDQVLTEVDSDVITDTLDQFTIDVNDLAPAMTLTETTADGGAAVAPITGQMGGRSQAGRKAMVTKYGGTAESEAAVGRGLSWLKRHQQPDGGWSFDHSTPQCDAGCTQHGSMAKSTAGATALALIAYMGSGSTYLDGEYQETIEAGLEYLLSQSKPTPAGLDCRGAAEGNSGMYIQGLATICLTEAVAMNDAAMKAAKSSDKKIGVKSRRVVVDDTKKLRLAATAATQFIINAQHSGGGWRYSPRQAGDTSVVGWQVMALVSGQSIKVPIPGLVFNGVSRFLDEVQIDGGSGYGYDKPGNKPSTTAIGLLCRMYMGAKKSSPALARGVAALSKKGPAPNDIYYNYYATQVMHHWGGEEWTKWNEVMREQLVKTQILKGHSMGSWNVADTHGGPGGRLYMTALATMTLEVYYRHLPLYDHLEPRKVALVK